MNRIGIYEVWKIFEHPNFSASEGWLQAYDQEAFEYNVHWKQ